MKRFILTLLLLLCLCGYSQAQMLQGIVGSGTSAAAAVSYYGYQGVGGTDNPLGGYEVHNSNYAITVTTGGTVVELSGYFKTTGAAGNVRLALYNVEGTSKICEGSAEVSVTSGTYSWVGHTAGGLTGSCTVSSATNYTISATSDDVAVNLEYISGKTSGDFGYRAEDYTGGFPVSVASGTASSAWFKMRVGVQ